MRKSTMKAETCICPRDPTLLSSNLGDFGIQMFYADNPTRNPMCDLHGIKAWESGKCKGERDG